MSRARRAAGRAALTLLSLAVALGAAEGIFRWRLAHAEAPDGGDDGWRRRYRHMNETIYRRSQDAELIYEPVPGSEVEMEYGPAGFNRAGMRDDREHPLDPPADRVRLAIVGDSLVFSEFLALHDSIPRRLAGALGATYEVLPFGVTGYDTSQEAAWYERAARPFSPRIVVVVWCMNDQMIMSGPFERFATPAERADKDAQEALMDRVAPVRRETIDAVLERREREGPSIVLARALGIFERWRFDRRYVDEYLVAFRQPRRRQRTRRALRRLGAAIEQDGAQGLLVISPVLESWHDYHWRPIHAFVEREARQAGLSVLDPLEAWRERHDAREMRVGGDNLHYDGSGARVMGTTIAEAVRGMERSSVGRSGTGDGTGTGGAGTGGGTGTGDGPGDGMGGGGP